ncbi:MAG: hypothetical protein V7709_11370, partial [Halioglobus sp.]
MNKFNLTFTGETLPGYDPDRVKAAFGDVLSVEDAAQIDQLFSGQTVILKRDLERKEAGTLYAQLHKAGADVALVKVVEGESQADPLLATPAPKPEPVPIPKPAKKSRISPLPSNRGMDYEIREAHPGRIDQSWPIPANPKTRKPIPAATPPASKKDGAQIKKAKQPKARKVILPKKAVEQDNNSLEQQKRNAESLALRREAEKALQDARNEEAKVIAAAEAAKSKAAEEAAKQKAAEDAARAKAEEEA